MLALSFIVIYVSVHQLRCSSSVIKFHPSKLQYGSYHHKFTSYSVVSIKFLFSEFRSNMLPHNLSYLCTYL
uniref:Uncharacterized protein n=1 Tax=Arundo donax TaxID=35708 RepID=A0A0A9DL11_ARUDO